MVVFGISERHLGRGQMKLNVGLVLALTAYVFWGVVPIFWKQIDHVEPCLLYTSPSPRDLSTSRMPSSA